MSTSADVGALRRGTLAASVLHDIPLQPSADGVLVGPSWDERGSWTPLAWSTLAEAVVEVDPESLTGRLRLRDWLHSYLLLTHLAPGAPVPARVVALALPAGHVLHPGAGWAQQQVLGGVLDVGLALRPDGPAVPDSPAALAPVPFPLASGAVRASGADLEGWWESAAEQRDSMAALAADRLDRDTQGVLRPIGGCDVLTLLSGRPLRARLAHADGTGMRAIAAPMRTRGWFDLARIDPAFVGAAAAATEPELRGLPRPLLVTADEVTLVPMAAPWSLARSALADPAAVQPHHERDVLFR